MKKLLLTLFFALSINAQRIDFPADLVGDNAKPDSPMFGSIRTLLTSSYRNGRLLGDILVETYDPNQKRIEIIRHSADIEIHTEKMVNLSHKQYLFYDSAKKLTERQSFENDANPTTVVKFIYDSKGRLQEMLVHSEGNKLVNKVTYSYDEGKKEVTIITGGYYGTRLITDKKTLHYNDKNQWTKRTTFDKYESVKDTVSFEYDKNGFFIKETTCCKYNFFHTYEYQFDKKGNWIERVEFYSQKDGEGKWVTSESLRTYRVITYYDEILK